MKGDEVRQPCPGSCPLWNKSLRTSKGRTAKAVIARVQVKIHWSWGKRKDKISSTPVGKADNCSGPTPLEVEAEWSHSQQAYTPKTMVKGNSSGRRKMILDESLNQGSGNSKYSIKGQETVNILGFASLTNSAASTQLCHCSLKAAMYNI